MHEIGGPELAGDLLQEQSGRRMNILVFSNPNCIAGSTFPSLISSLNVKNCTSLTYSANSFHGNTPEYHIGRDSIYFCVIRKNIILSGKDLINRCRTPPCVRTCFDDKESLFYTCETL